MISSSPKIEKKHQSPTEMILLALLAARLIAAKSAIEWLVGPEDEINDDEEVVEEEGDGDDDVSISICNGESWNESGDG